MALELHYLIIESKIVTFLIWSLYLISLYISVYLLLVFFEDDEKDDEKEEKQVIVAENKIYDLENNFPDVTILIPGWNEEKTITPTVESVLNLDYPKDKLHIICINDGSTDNTSKVLDNLLKKYENKYDFKVLHQTNGGKYTALNHGLKYVKTPFFSILDADSFVEPNSLKLILKNFTKEKIVSVMPSMKVHNPKNYLEILQWLEYLVNVYYKKVLEKINAIHVAPGPFSTFRTKYIKKLGGYKKAYLTEDLEIALRLQDNHYELKQELDAVIYTKVPSTIKQFYRQRVRWYYGTMKNVIDYKRFIFNPSYGDFGMFFFPLVALTGILSLTGGFLAIYLASKKIYRYIKDLFLVKFDIMTFYDWNFAFPGWLDLDYMVIFSTISLMFITIIFIVHSFKNLNEKAFKYRHKSIIIIWVYFFLYGIIIAYSWLLVLFKLIFNKDNLWYNNNTTKNNILVSK